VTNNYADAEYWDAYFASHRERGADLDWGGLWVAPFLPLLYARGVESILELGCGTGNDAARFAREGFQVVAVDLSAEAVGQARDRFDGLDIDFRVADFAEPLPFRSALFDAVVANVALHMFSDRLTRAIVEEVRRVLRPGGLFLFHVNSTTDRILRERRRPIERELEPDYVLEKSGQAVRFFSRAYIDDLLGSWVCVDAKHVQINDPETGAAFKRVW
jgi:SAM-dependent methyltransferase